MHADSSLFINFPNFRRIVRKIPIPVVIISIIILTSIVVYSADAAGIPKKAISTVARFLESDLPTTTVFTDQASTYAAGQKQTFQGSTTTAGLSFAGVSSDPSGVTAGDIWRITGNDTFKVRGNSGTQTIHTTNALAQFSTFAGPTTAIKSLTPVMGGFNIQFTPHQTGRVLIEFTFNCITATKLDGCLVQPAYGTGTPPTGNAAITGTTVGSQYLINGNSVASSAKAGGSVSIVITGLTVGTQYWVDFQWASSVTNVNAQISDVQAAIVET